MVEPREEVSITDLRRRLREMLRNVERFSRHYAVVFHHRPIAQLVPVLGGTTLNTKVSNPEIQSLSTTELRDQLHVRLRDVEYQRLTYLITNRGTPIALLMPVHPTSERPTKGDVMLQPIIALVSLKGGVGKTTSTMHLAAVAAREGRQVTVLDGDSEHSALHWSELALQLGALPFNVMACEERTLITQARELRDAGNVVVIDTPPNDRTLLIKAAGIADHVVVPVAPTGIDLDRLRGTLQLLADTSAISNREIDIAILLIRFTARKALAREAEELLRDFPMIETKIRALKTYEEAFGSNPEYLEEYLTVWKEIVA